MHVSPIRWLLIAASLMASFGSAIRAQEEVPLEERVRKLEALLQLTQQQLQANQQQIAEKDQHIVEQERRIRALEQSQTKSDKTVEELLEKRAYFAPLADSKDDNTFKAFWKEGLRFSTANKEFQLMVGGRIMFDYINPWEDDTISDSIGEQEVMTNFRRARIELGGTIYKNFVYKAVYDIAEDGDGASEFKDVYLGLTNLPGIGTATFGNQFEPWGLEIQTSSKYITFMERDPINEVFSAGRNPGLRLENSHLDDRITWALGAFRLGNVDGENSTDDDADIIEGDGTDDYRPSDGQANWRFGGRVTGLPWYEDSGKKLVHLGLNYSYQMHPTRTLRHRARPGVATVERFVDTGTFTADDSHVFGAEMALVYDSWSFQAEYMARLDQRGIGNFTDDAGAPPTFGIDNAEDPFFQGYYVMGSYFLTGESRPYSKDSGLFGRVKPKRNFWASDTEIGLGAWEVALRYGWLDLDSRGPEASDLLDTSSRIRGGLLQTLTFGVNWYLNPNARFMFNYVFADVEDGDPNDVVLDGAAADNLRTNGQMQTFMMRFQVDF